MKKRFFIALLCLLFIAGLIVFTIGLLLKKNTLIMTGVLAFLILAISDIFILVRNRKK